MNPVPIDVPTAARLLDFASRIGEGPRADEQLAGAVAVHNLLVKHRVAYLADEVGMGKTYVALGALALFRHFQPDFRVLVVAPRENIQKKWVKEFGNFVAHNVRHPDLRVKAIDGRPAKPLVLCHNLLELAHEVCLDGNRDFFVRLTSFSLPFDSKRGDELRKSLKGRLPWLKDDLLFDLRSKEAFKDNFARALCCALPAFDLVIVDEAHNLKHGFGENVSARNRVLGLAMGHPDAGADEKLFPGYGPRAGRVLFLSATPVEETYRHLWNQLDVFGRGGPYESLCDSEADEETQKEVAGRFLVRRVTSIKVNGKEHTKNLYRREWRRGGVRVHDEPIRVTDARQRLVVALVQKKVGELLGHERFQSSFQIGMLASFESFLETAKLKRDDPEAANFDDAEQVKNEADDLKREGLDVRDVNKLARDYRARFDAEMPHPKMDALVDELQHAWTRGHKSLVFVRRVASVKELKRKLDDRYDAWLRRRLIRELPADLHEDLEGLFRRYRTEKSDLATKKRQPEASPVEPGESDEPTGADDGDRGGYDTFFAWFFRGDGPSGVVSGANVQKRYRSGSSATFFEDNYVADVLGGCPLADVPDRLARALNVDPERLLAGLRERSRAFLTRAKKHTAADRFEAVQAAAVEWLHETPGPHQEAARGVWQERFASLPRFDSAAEVPDVADWLRLPTFFTELRRRPELRKRLWPEPRGAGREAFRERATRAQLLASAARLGHAFIDLYVVTMQRLGSFASGAQEAADEDAGGAALGRINDYLDRLELQMATPLGAGAGEREWAAFDELADIAENYPLIIDVNAHEVRDPSTPLAEMAAAFGTLLGQQLPVAGMSGQVNYTAVRQFRMPGYPLVLISTDLLQEGEDLHTFCSSVHHYGIAWTPSAMEQRIGRVDRVRSQTDRRLSAQTDTVAPDDKLQVYFPHLEDTVEVLQVHRVLDRMNVFLRLMHAGLVTAGREDGTIDAAKEFVRARRPAPQAQGVLKTAFPVQEEFLKGEPRPVASSERVRELVERFAALAKCPLPDLEVVWEPQAHDGRLLGTAKLGPRVQPFTLLLKSVGSRPLVRCVSPVGRVGPGGEASAIRERTARVRAVKLGAIEEEDRTYDLTAEGDCLLGASAESDAVRVAMLVGRVVRQADDLEQHFLDSDERLAAFRSDLDREGDRGE
jgi:hypothetical protein